MDRLGLVTRQDHRQQKYANTSFSHTRTNSVSTEMLDSLYTKRLNYWSYQSIDRLDTKKEIKKIRLLWNQGMRRMNERGSHYILIKKLGAKAIPKPYGRGLGRPWVTKAQPEPNFHSFPNLVLHVSSNGRQLPLNLYFVYLIIIRH